MHVVIFATLAALAAGTTDDGNARAREEVETQLVKELGTSIPAPAMTIRFAPSAGRGYALESARFELDGKPVASPPLDKLRNATGAETVFHGNISQGTHELAVHLLYAGDFGMLSYMTGYKFKLAQKVTFEAHRGLEIGLDLAPKLDQNQDWQHRLSIGVKRTDTMLAQIDATEPTPLSRPKKPELIEPPPPPPVEVAAADEPKPPPEQPKTDDSAAKSSPARPTKVARTARPATEPEPAPQPVAVAQADEKPPEPAVPATVTIVQALSPTPAPIVAATSPIATSQAGGPDWHMAALAAGLVILGAISLFVWRRRGSRA